jgi:hypothetical protein
VAAAAASDELFEAALEEALVADDVAQALRDLELSSASSWRDQLIAEIRGKREQASAAASSDLTRLAQCELDLERALDDAVAGEIGQSPNLSSRTREMRERLAQLDSRLERLRTTYDTTSKTASRTENGPTAEGSLRPRLRLRRVLPRRLRAIISTDDRLLITAEALARAEAERESLQTELARLEESIREQIRADPSRWTAVVVARSEVDAARTRARRSLLERGILDIARPWLKRKTESQLRERYSTDLASADAPGLAELPNRKHEVATGAADRLGRLLEQLPGGSVGISGPRGAGKTTLMSQFCHRGHRIHDKEPRLTLTVAAPVEYAPLEFVLHLFARACLAVLPEGFRENELQDDPDSDAVFGKAARGFALLAVAVSCAVAIAGIALLATALGERTRGPGDHRLTIGIAAALAVAVSLGAALEAPLRLIRTWATERREYGPRILPRFGLVSLAISPTATTALVAVAVLLLGFSKPPGGANSTIVFGVALLAGVAWLIPMLDALLRSATRAVETRLRGPTPESRSYRESLGLLSARIGSRAIAYTGAMTLVVAITLLAFAFIGHPVGADVGGAIVIALTGLIATRFTSSWASNLRYQWAALRFSDRDRELQPIEQAAFEHLQKIRFQQTISSGVSGKVTLTLPKVPLSAEAGLDTSRALAERSWTLPEAIDHFRRFIEDAAAEQPALIGIDELDKMSGEAAEKFLNAVKANFGIPNCYFLVSVSEDAVASFERRGLPFRDVFDSAFDEVMHIGYLGLADTERLLAPRVIRMPIQFVTLCYCLSAGLPRDVIRTARSLIQLRKESNQRRLGELTRNLVERELEAKLRATSVTICRLSGPESARALDWLGQLTLVTPSIAALTSAIGTKPPLLPASPADGANGRDSVEQIVNEFTGYWYFCATLVEIFTNGLKRPRMLVGEQGIAESQSFERLALARQDFAVSPSLALVRLDAFRSAWKLKPCKAIHPLAITTESSVGATKRAANT